MESSWIPIFILFLKKIGCNSCNKFMYKIPKEKAAENKVKVQEMGLLINHLFFSFLN